MTCDVTQSDITEQNLEYLHASTESTGLKFCRVDVLEDLHIVIALRLYHRKILITRPLPS